MPCRRLIVAGTGSGVGKTTAAIGLMAAYRRLGHEVQGFKCGPDYIDPTYHAAATGRTARNLDSWMFSGEAVREALDRGTAGADVAIIEGVMGLFDGKEASSNRGSAADIAALTDTPVLLVVDCQGMARSAAAVVRGFQTFSPATNLCGVFANRVGSEGHYELIRRAVEGECGIPVFGYLKRETELELPERHLGLVPSVERGELAPFFERLAERITASTDLARLREAMGDSRLRYVPELFAGAPRPKRARIAIAKDEAFHFYYPENLELLRHFGAELVCFSPLRGETLPQEADGLYIGGGFPEQFAPALAAQTAVSESVRRAAAGGMPVLAECGGFMYLTEELVDADGTPWPMAGLIPGRVRMQPKPAAIGYREIRGMPGNPLFGPGESARGHEFHYSVFEPREASEPAYDTSGLRRSGPEGCLAGNVVAGYTHIHFASNPTVARRFVEWCAHAGNR